jgi:polysaccharide export outer membrane protein
MMNSRMKDQTQKARHALSVLIVLTVLAGAVACTSLPKEVLDAVNGSSKEFLIGPEDVLDVMVWRNQDLSRTVVVRPDGMISIPLIGDVEATGVTANQLAERLAARLKEFKETPSVTVSVKEVNSYNVYVLGEVAKPGKYQLKSHTTVLQAIALAGGFTIYASKNKIQVVRNSGNGDGRPQEIRIPARYDDLVSGKGELGNFALKAADIVVVP